MGGPTHRAAFLFILVSVFLEALAFGLIFPVLPRVVVQFMGGDAGHAAQAYGLIVAVWAAANLFAAPVLGSLSDRHGRRPVILIAAFGFSVDMVIMALAPNLVWLFVGRAIAGLTAGSFSAMSAYIADVTEPDRRASRFGVFSAVFGAGMILGPAVGGLLSEITPRAPFWLGAALSALAFLYGLFVLPESFPPEKRDPDQVRSVNPFESFGLLRTAPGLPRLAVVNTLVALASQSVNAIFVLYLAHRFGWDTAQCGLLLTAFGAGNILVMGVIVPWASRRFGEWPTTFAGLALSAVGLAGLGLADGPLMFCLACVPTCLGNVCGPPLRSLQTLTVGPTEQGRLQGVMGGLGALTQLVGPLAFTQVYAASILLGDAWLGLSMLGGAVLLALALLVAMTPAAARRP